MSFLSIVEIPDAIGVQTDTNMFGLDKSSVSEWGLHDIHVCLRKENGKLKIFLSSPSESIKRVLIRWKRNVPANLTILGDHWERGYGDLEWRSIVPERVLPWYFITNDGEHTHGYGVKTAPHAMCFWQVDSSGIGLWLDVRNGGNGVQLGVRELLAATVVEREGNDHELPFEAAQFFCQVMCENPILPKTPVYGGNNWYYAYGNSSHEEILDDSKLISSLASSSENRPFMVIDDGWQICHLSSCNGGPWILGNYKFPDMEKLAQQMKEIGTRPGIWMRPLLTSAKVPHSAILKNKKHPGFNFNGEILDPSNPYVLETIAQDVERIASWGYELIKHDFSTYDLFGKWGFEMGAQLTDDNWSYGDPSKTTAEIVLDLYRTIRDSAGEISIIGCNTISHLAAGIMEIQRTGDDTSGLEWERTRKYGINTLSHRMPQHGTFYAVDADCVGITNKIPWDFNKQWLELLSLSGTPLFVSAAPDAIGKEQEKALKRAFEATSKPLPVGQPLDWISNTCPEKWLLNGSEYSFDWYGKFGAIPSFGNMFS
jgi:alpha-galactosidase